MFGGGVALGPKKIAELVGINVGGLSNGAVGQAAEELIPGGVYNYGSPAGRSLKAASAPKRLAGWWEKRQLAKNALLKATDPAWYKEKRWQQAKYVHTIDIDIASFRSVSLAGMVAFQRQRNFDQQLKMEEKTLSNNLQEKLWREAFGDSDDD